jgi:F-type H+-transporting ATPase subunit b
MFDSARSWYGWGLIPVVAGLMWISLSTVNLSAQEKPPEQAAKAVDAKDAAHEANDAPHKEQPAGHDAATAGHDNHAAPKAPLDFKADLALWSLIVFILFVTVLKVFAWGPLGSALNAREHKIKSDIALAEEARVKAEKMLVEYQSKLAAAQDEVLKTLAEARRDAEHTRQEIMAQTEKEVAATKERAILEIERTKDAALEELFKHMAGTVANATERVLGRALTDADQDRLIGDALAEFSRGQAS